MNFTTKISVLLLASSALAIAAPFTNGSFESPGTSTSFALPNGSTFVSGWTYTGSNSNVFYTTSNTFGILAGEGNLYLTFGGNGAGGGIMSQTFDTISGTTYNVNYLVTTQQGAVTSPFQTNSVQAFDGVNLLAGVANSLGMANGTWVNGTQLTFTASSSSTTLRFTDTNSVNTFGGINWGLDNVTVNAVASNGNAVPEPATCALVLASLGAIALHRRKR